MTAPTLDSFFAGGGGKSVSWKDKPIGTTVTGTIKVVHPPEQQTDPVDNKPQFKRDGVTPKMSVRIDLATSERDPADPEDDGGRGLYVQGWMQGAVGDALRKAGRQGPPEVGATLTVTLIERTPNDRPGLNPTNKFSATYVSPTSAATGEFFNSTPAAVAVPGSPTYQAPPAAEALPPRPPTVPEASWAAMPDNVKRQVAEAVGDIPF